MCLLLESRAEQAVEEKYIFQFFFIVAQCWSESN
jgi:hypothetical protein